MDSARLFGAAIANVQDERRRASRAGTLRSDNGFVRGRRLELDRRLSRGGDDMNDSYKAGRSQRHIYRASPYEDRGPPSDPGIPWKHDKFEGDVAAHPGSQIFVRNLPQSVTKQQLMRLFSGAGDVVSVKIDSGPLTTARIGFLKKNSAEEAVETLHGYKLFGHAIKVSEFQTLEKPPHDALSNGKGFSERPALRRKSSTRSPRDVLISEAPRRSVFERLG